MAIHSSGSLLVTIIIGPTECSGVGAAAAAAAMAAALLRQLGEVEGHCTCAKHQTSCSCSINPCVGS